MEKVGQIIDKISYVMGYFAGLILLGIIGLTMMEVVSRYILNHPLILCDEFGGYSLLAITFLGLAYCGKEKGHIRITFLVERMKAQTAGRIRLASLILVFAYIAIGSKVSWDFLIGSFQRNMRANSWLMTPLKWPQMVLPIGFTLFALVLLVQIGRAIRDLKAGRNIEESGGEEF